LASRETISLGTEASFRVFELDYRVDPRWKRFISSHPDALIYHHPGWAFSVRRGIWQRCVALACSDDAGKICAVLPLFYTKGLPFVKLSPVPSSRRLSSLPRTPIAGPLALTGAAAQALLRYAVKLANSDSSAQLEIKTQIPDLNRCISDLVCVPWRPTFVEELPSAIEGTRWDEFWENLRLPRLQILRTLPSPTIWQCQASAPGEPGGSQS
jgi:hypothetical protein